MNTCTKFGLIGDTYTCIYNPASDKTPSKFTNMHAVFIKTFPLKTSYEH